jgi:glycosyltransferase involved in cell wall biosynthesis
MTNKPIVFDAMLTLYETRVLDRKTMSVNSIKANLLYLLDYTALHCASLVLSDTDAHAQYYSHFYGLASRKLRRVPVGSDDEVFFPRRPKKEDDCFRVIFWGGFIPLQGVKYIIKAAKLLESYKDVNLELRGFGQTYNEALELARSLKVKNVTFVSNWISYSELPSYIAKADVCLGIFGETEKAQRVIPNKAVEAIAMRKPLITGDSPATKELFTHKKNCLLVPMADPKAIAEAILMLRQDKKLRNSIAEKGYTLFTEKLCPKAVGKELKSILVELIESR